MLKFTSHMHVTKIKNLLQHKWTETKHIMCTGTCSFAILTKGWGQLMLFSVFPSCMTKAHSNRNFI